jgi:hypothetical protein
MFGEPNNTDIYDDYPPDCDRCGSLEIDPERRYNHLTNSDVLCAECCDEAENES